MSESYTGVRVVDTRTDIISKIYKDKFLELMRNSDGTFTPDFDKRLNPDSVADTRKLPFKSDQFNSVVALIF